MHYSGFFYGVPGDKLDEFRAAVATLKTIFSSVYSADNLIPLNRNLSFTQDNFWRLSGRMSKRNRKNHCCGVCIR
jgi:hypothetical protein